MTANLVDIELDLIFETDDAFCVSNEEEKFGVERNKFWLPKSQVEYDGKTTFTMPTWLAERKDLL